MKTVGEILKKARLGKGIKRQEIVEKTKISLKYLKALEDNDFSNLPEAAFVKGFIRNYAGAVGVEPKQALAVFRRDYDQTEKGKVIPREFTANAIKKRTFWNPKTTMIGGIIFISITLAVYFIYQFQLLTAPPELKILSPEEDEQVMTTLTVNGSTDPQATLTINNQQVLVEEDGSFTQSLVLSQGTRTITIQATNRNGKSRTIQRTIRVEP